MKIPIIFKFSNSQIDFDLNTKLQLLFSETSLDK